MNKNWSPFPVLAISGAMAVLIIVLLPRKNPDKIRSASDSAPSASSETNVRTNLPTIRRGQFSGDDTADLINRFQKRFKPEIARWCKVYQGRLPFNSDDVTPNKFHSKVGGSLYTFMIGDTTFTVYDGPQGTHVFYMMARQAAEQLNSVPSGATQHDISTPVTRPVIAELLRADSGIDYPADQISVSPTGQFSSMPGGVMVEAGGIDGSGVYRVMTSSNLDFVLDGNGMLVSYQR